MALGSPGDRSQLLELIGLLEPSPFDPDRGPWDVTLIEGLEGGKAALYLRAHHVLTDGQGGLSTARARSSTRRSHRRRSSRPPRLSQPG